METKQKGNLTELNCITSFVKCGCGVSIPYGDNLKYDFIADVDGQLLKIQVKTSSLKKNNPNVIKFSCVSTHVNSSGVKNVKYKDGEIDFFATFWNGVCYLIPASQCSREKALHFGNTKNCQNKGINFADDFELEKVLNLIKSRIDR